MIKKNENLEQNLKVSVIHAFRLEKYWRLHLI